jgi:hypothetical protein
MGGAISMRRDSRSSLINSIFWGNTSNQFVMNSLTDTTPCYAWFYNCDIQDGLDSIIVLDTNISIIHWDTSNMAVHPQFRDSLSGDFRLGDYSHCLGKGADSVLVEGVWIHAPVTDLEGSMRPNPAGSHPDLGAYESALAGPLGISGTGLPGPHIASLSPNPCKAASILHLQLKRPATVSLSLYNSFGSCVLARPATRYDLGDHFIPIDCMGLESGLYYLQLKTGKRKVVKKLMLIR